MVLHSKIMFSLKFYKALKKYFLVITDFVNNHNKKSKHSLYYYPL